MGAYTWAGRGNVYAFFEEEKEKFEKSVYARRAGVRHLGGQRRRVHIRFYQDNEELSS